MTTLAASPRAVPMDPPMSFRPHPLKPLATLAFSFAAEACGGGSSSGGADAGPAPIEPKLSVIQQRILTPGCALSSCHGSAAAGRLSLVEGRSHAQLVNVPSVKPAGCGDAGVAVPRVRVMPGDPERSFLVDKLAHDTAWLSARCQGTSMPQANPMLDAAAVQAVRTWIAQGALDN